VNNRKEEKKSTAHVIASPDGAREEKREILSLNIIKTI
jgi:hypothetical protein